MTKSVHIGGASAFISDSATATPQLLCAERLDYLIYDYLAEVTMSMLGKAKAKDPQKGYAPGFISDVWTPNGKLIAERGVKLIANAGGVNPLACRAALEAASRALGLAPKIAVVLGDDLYDARAAIAAVHPVDMFSGEAFPPVERIRSINVYLGAFGIAKALALGADIVVTGRVVDSALALGALIHEFGWRANDFDKLAAGTLIGHILECGAQATGGLFTDWEDVPDWAHIGYPIAECFADGSFNLTKPRGTGGLCSRGAVTEQMLYEIGDPQAYIVPDVVCDFSQVTIEQAGEDLVHVRGAIGYPPTRTYKACATFQDGFRATVFYPVLGIDAPRKARRQAQATLTRCAELLRARNLAPYRATRVDVIGGGATYGDNEWSAQSREVAVKIAVEHEERAALDILLQEWAAPMTSMACGTTNWYGNQQVVNEVVRLFSFVWEKNKIEMQVLMDDRAVAVDPAPSDWFDARSVKRPVIADVAVDDDDLVEVPLIALAWGRSGDKGDSFNVGIIARRLECLPFLRRTLTAEFVRDVFAHEFTGDPAEARVERFDLPGAHALNFLVHRALGGGGAATLRVDMLAKGKAQQLLGRRVMAPRALVRSACAPES